MFVRSELAHESWNGFEASELRNYSIIGAYGKRSDSFQN